MIGKLDPSEINNFILNAAHNKDPVFYAYQLLCEKHKDRKIDYVDFEWKYFQFYHGNRDLTIERSLVTFSDLPMDVLETVVTKLNLLECLSLRQLSHDLRNLVDSTEVHCKSMGIEFEKNFSIINIEGAQLSYSPDDDGFSRVSMERYWPQKWKRCSAPGSQKRRNYSTPGSHDQLLIAEASKTLKNPKLKIDRLSFETCNVECFDKFLDFLKSLDFQLNVRSIYIPRPEKLFSPILSFLKPGRLAEIELGQLTIDQFNEVTESEQWKRARKLYCRPFLQEIQVEKFLHFEKIEFCFKFSDENVNAVIELLSKSAHLEWCNIVISTDLEDSDEEDQLDDYEIDGRINRILSQNRLYNSETRRFSIPNSEEYFQLEHFRKQFDVGPLELTIKKVSKNR